LIGGYGGGYAALLMAGRHPEIWAGVSAWCPISDIEAWYAESKTSQSGYAENIEKSCSGNPAIAGNADPLIISLFMECIASRKQPLETVKEGALASILAFRLTKVLQLANQ